MILIVRFEKLNLEPFRNKCFEIQQSANNSNAKCVDVTNDFNLVKHSQHWYRSTKLYHIVCDHVSDF